MEGKKIKKTMILVAALVLSLIGNIWLGVQLNIVNSNTVTAMASVAAAEQTANIQGEKLSELTQKLSDAEAKTQAVQAELDKVTALQKEQTEQKAKADELASVVAQQEAAKKAEEEKLQNSTDPDAGIPDKPTTGNKPTGGGSGSGGSNGGNQGGQKEPAGGIMGSTAGKAVEYGAMTDVGEWNSEIGAWWATDSSGTRGWLFPEGSFFEG